MEHSTDSNFNVKNFNGEWVSIRPNAKAPHCSTCHDANAAAKSWASHNRQKWAQSDGRLHQSSAR